MNFHWTAKNIENYFFSIALYFIEQVEDKRKLLVTTKKTSAKHWGITKSQVEQIVNHPENLKLKVAIKYARAFGLKVSLVAYDDGDANNELGPINSEIFKECWVRCGKPRDFWYDMVSAMDVSNYFLLKAHQNGEIINNLKLQKLLYYAQSWYLANYNIPIFIDTIEAKPFGPVVTEVYNKFKKFESSPIIYKKTGKEVEKFTKTQHLYLDEFYAIFIKFQTFELTNMARSDLPWIAAYNNKEKEISHKAMKEYYFRLIEHN